MISNNVKVSFHYCVQFWWFNTNEYKDQLKRKTDMMKACGLMRA